MYFQYDLAAYNYLKKADPILGKAMDTIGPIERPLIPDLYAALVNSIIGQQISTKAWETIWQRLMDTVGEITPKNILACTDGEIQAVGITFKKVDYIKGAARKFLSGELDSQAFAKMSDDEICQELVKLKGIGIWTAEMLLIFSLQRKDVLSWDDLAIHRGLRMVYHLRKITKPLFAKYKRRCSPYASIASLYLWEIASGAIPEMKDYAPLTDAAKKKRAKDAKTKALKKKNQLVKGEKNQE